MSLDPDLTLADPVEPLLENARDRVKPRLDAVQKHLSDSNATLPVKLEALSNLLLELLPVAFGEAYSVLPNIDRAQVLGRVVAVVRGIVDMELAAHKNAASAELNPYGWKFQLAFATFFDSLRTAMVEEGVSEKQLHHVFQRLAGRLTGWEDKLETALRGVPDRDLARVPNPFLPSPPG